MSFENKDSTKQKVDEKSLEKNDSNQSMELEDKQDSFFRKADVKSLV